MNFASIEYIVFLALVWAAYLVLPRRGQNVLLLIASYYFYAAWDWRFLSLIWLSTAVDYTTGRIMASTQATGRRKAAMITSVVVNLTLLGVFKYFGFFVESADTLLHAFGFTGSLPVLQIVLPVGISFYTFQTMSYSIDVYRGVMPATRDPLDFALFVAFFPQLVAGPIERAKHLLPILANRRKLEYDEIVRGLFLILLGLVKKLAVADGLSRSVNAIYNSHADVSGLDVTLATYAFAFQILCDFSAYTDIARGTAKLFGIDLMINFDAPYLARSPSDFWRRWHISLSTWLRDYLYIPLGGNRGSGLMTYRNLMLTMVLGGLWHGAAWNFVLWGIYQGAILCIFRLCTPSRQQLPKVSDPLPKPTIMATLRGLTLGGIGVLLYFQITCYGWLLFRANSFDQIVSYTAVLFDPTAWSSSVFLRPPLSTLAGLCVLIPWEVATYAHGKASFYRAWHPLFQGVLVASLLILLLMSLTNEAGTFIYFQF